VNKNPKYEHLKVYRYKSGTSGNRNGRPKSYLTLLKELGYSTPMLAVMVAEIAFMPCEEVRELSLSTKEPAIRVTIAKAFSKATYSGDYRYISDFLSILTRMPVPFIQPVPNK
jgi:hypothetical protein